MSDSSRFPRPQIFTVIAWVAAVGFFANAVLSYVWFREISILQWVLVALWALLAVMYSRPYAVVADDALTLWASPLRSKVIRWSDVSSVEQVRPGFLWLHLADGKKVGVVTEAVRKSLRPQFDEALRSHLPAF